MATHQITITYPDARQAELLDLIKFRAATPDNPAPTTAQALQWLDDQVRGFVGAVLRESRKAKDAADAAAAATSIDIS